MAHLHEWYLEQVERDERLERYAAAYARIPETEAEKALADLTMESMASEAP